MMAHWDLAGLEDDLVRLNVPVALVAGRRDRTVSAVEADVVHRRLPDSEVTVMDACGHLAHEEAPKEVARVTIDFARRHGVLVA
jgi:magnesium chelatase accessory protein